MGRRWIWVLLACAAVVVAGCGGTKSPPPKPSPTAHASASATPKPTQVTVIAPDGVNLRSGPTTTAGVLGVVAQGVTLPIVSETTASGGWWQVKGSTNTGWISSNPLFTSTASFQMYQSGGTGGWSVLYPLGWQFAQQSSGSVAFNGPQGESITVTQAASTAQLPAAAPAGTARSDVTSTEVYGITTSLVTFGGSSGYLAAVAFQANPGLALLIVAKGHTASSTSADFKLFLDTVKFPVH